MTRIPFIPVKWSVGLSEILYLDGSGLKGQSILSVDWNSGNGSYNHVNLFVCSDSVLIMAKLGIGLEFIGILIELSKPRDGEIIGSRISYS